MTTAKADSCNVQLVGTHRPTGRRFGWPKRAFDGYAARDFWRQLKGVAAGLDYSLRDFTAAVLRRGDPAQKWEHDAALSAALSAELEAARPAPAVGP
jgi:hypothetical protein